ncbi:hypothetical protein [Streptomyces sp. NPDC055099]
MRTPSVHNDPRLPLHRKPRLRLVVIGVVAVGVTAVLPPENVSACAEIIGAAASAAVLFGKRREEPTLT